MAYLGWNRSNVGPCPCKDCEERYPACHDQCGKFREFRKEIDRKRIAEQTARESSDILSESKKRAIWRKQRYNRNKTFRRLSDR